MKHDKGKSASCGAIIATIRRYSPLTLGVVALLAPTLSRAINTWPDSGTTVTSSETKRYDGAVTGPFGTPEIPRRSRFDLPAFALARTDATLEDTSLTCPRAGNPVVIGTGRKFEVESDIPSLPGEMGLSLGRTWGAGDGDGIFGYGWHSNLDRKLQFVTANPSDPNICSPGPAQGECSIIYRVTTLWALRPDGRRIRLLGDNPAQSWKLTALPGGSGWSVRTEDNTVEEYTYGGLIKSIKNEQGIGWTFTYGGSRNAQLQSVTHTGGRKFSFLWSGNQVQTVLDPENNAYQYAYTVIDQHSNDPTGKTVLSDVVLPGPPATKISYHYGNIAPAGSLVRSGLLGKSFNGVRYSYFTYDKNYRVKSTEHAGGVERYTFDYILDPASSTSDVTRKVQKTTVTNPLNRKAEYSFNPQGRLTSVAGMPSANCGASYREITYDANGNEDVVSDFENKLTDYDYDAHGHLLMKVEAKGLPIARVTRYVWDESKNRLTRVTVDEDHETTYSYGGDDRLSAVSERNLKSVGLPQQVRTTTYAYTKHANGMLASVTQDGPLPDSADAVTSAYSPTGDLISVRNGLGHEVAYGNYTPLGMPRHVVGENGAVTDYTYDARNRLVNVRTYPNNVAADTQYKYNDAGLLNAIIAPDGVRTSYLYDDAQRLADEYQTEAAGTFAIKHYKRNAMSLPTRIQVRRAAAAPVIARTLAAPVINAPTTASAAFEVNWNAVPQATFYRLEESASSGSWTVLQEDGALKATISNRSNGSYAYRVRACNGDSCGPYSATATTTVSGSSIVPPSALAVTYFVDSTRSPPYTTFKGTWSAAAGATKYELTENGKVVYSGIALTYEYTRAGGGPSVPFQVRACNGAECSAWSASVLPVLR